MTVVTHRNVSPPNGTRIAPHDLDIETGLLGAGFDPSGAGLEVLAQVAAEDFYRPAHQWIAAVMLRASVEGWQPDPNTVAAELDSIGLLERVGGLGELLTLAAGRPATSSVRRYPQILKRHAASRRMIAYADDLAEAGYRGENPAPILAHITAELAETTSPAGPIVLQDVDRALDNPEAVEPHLLRRSDGALLLYPASVNTISAEPSVGKTTVAAMVAIQVFAMGGRVLFLDYEDIIGRVVARLRALGAPTDHLAHQFAYAQPAALQAIDTPRLLDLVDKLNPDLVVIDGVAEALALQGADEDKAGQVAAWWELLPRPLARSGCCVLMLDHVVKRGEDQGRWARGSGHKLAAVDGAAYIVKSLEPFSRTRPGKLALVVAKDRPGAIGATGETAAIVRIEPVDDGARIEWSIDPSPVTDRTSSPHEPFVSLDLREGVLAVLEDLTADGGSSRRTIRDHLRAREIKFGDQALGAALATLEREGAITRRVDGKAHFYTLPVRQPTLAEATP